MTDRWRQRWPGAAGGVLAARAVTNPERHVAFDHSLTETEERLRNRYGEMTRAEIRETGNLAHYHRYYRSFGQNYHVQHQIESIVLKGKTIPRRDVLVEVAYKWELEHGLLTGIHDLDHLTLPLVLEASDGTAAYELYSGSETAVKEDDMYYRDQRGVLSSVILGPAAYGRVGAETSAVIVVVYGVPGVPEADIQRHLCAIWTDIQWISPGAELIGLETHSS